MNLYLGSRRSSGRSSSGRGGPSPGQMESPLPSAGGRPHVTIGIVMFSIKYESISF